jgi:acetyltransferase-like isoleucine patch superfamily enzyme
MDTQINTDQARANMKFSTVFADPSRSSAEKYRDLCYGNAPFGQVLWTEFVVMLAGGVQGAFGLWLRSKLYPSLFKVCGSGVIFGRNITIRHPGKISIGNNVVLDDNSVIDAKGESNTGITVGNNVFIGRNSIVYCKNGDIEIRDRVSIASDCTIMSAHRLLIQEDVMIGGYCYILSGGDYDYTNKEIRFSDKSGAPSKGDLVIGQNCWLGARATVLDAASIGDNCVIGACSLVNKPIPPNSLAYGVPAKVIKSL